MGLIAKPVLGKRKSYDICQAFLDGYVRGYRKTREEQIKGQGVVFFGIDESNYLDWRDRSKLKQGLSYYYIDNSYFNKTRGTHYRVTRDAIQHHGPWESDGARWAALGYEVKPWRSIDTGHIVVCPQSDAFMKYTVRLYTPGANTWLADTLATLKTAYPGREIRVRPWSSNKLEISKTLHEDLEGAGLLVTHSSAAAIEAVIEGIPVMVSPASSLSDVTPDQRIQCLQTLADNQWTLDEIRNGDAWRWLNR